MVSAQNSSSPNGGLPCETNSRGPVFLPVLEVPGWLWLMADADEGDACVTQSWTRMQLDSTWTQQYGVTHVCSIPQFGWVGPGQPEQDVVVSWLVPKANVLGQNAVAVPVVFGVLKAKPPDQRFSLLPVCLGGVRGVGWLFPGCRQYSLRTKACQ